MLVERIWGCSQITNLLFIQVSYVCFYLSSLRFFSLLRKETKQRKVPRPATTPLATLAYHIAFSICVFLLFAWLWRILIGILNLPNADGGPRRVRPWEVPANFTQALDFLLNTSFCQENVKKFHGLSIVKRRINWCGLEGTSNRGQDVFLHLFYIRVFSCETWILFTIFCIFAVL